MTSRTCLGLFSIGRGRKDCKPRANNGLFGVKRRFPGEGVDREYPLVKLEWFTGGG